MEGANGGGSTVNTEQWGLDEDDVPSQLGLVRIACLSCDTGNKHEENESKHVLNLGVGATILSVCEECCPLSPLQGYPRPNAFAKA